MDCSSIVLYAKACPYLVLLLGIIMGRGNLPGSKSGYCSGPGGGMVNNTCTPTCTRCAG